MGNDQSVDYFKSKIFTFFYSLYCECRLVTSELIFYVSSLKSLHVLRDDETVEVFSKDLWNVPR